jgi:integrase
VVHEGRDPIRERERERRKAARNMHLLSDIAIDAFESRKASLRGDGVAGRWFTPLALHVLPRLGATPVADLDQIAIRDTLAPIWHAKADTARKALNRLGLVMQHAAALGLDVDLQACAKAKALLGKQRHTAVHIPALPWVEVPAFYASLEIDTVCHLALKLLILTAVRSRPLRFLRLEQIDGDVWTVPAAMQKGRLGKTSDFRVPLSREALDVIERAKPFARDGFLFPSIRRGVISDATMARLMQRRGMDARPHGMRSSFRDWVAEATTTPHDVAEMALGHTVGGAVERAYRRSDLIQQRRALAERWAGFVTGAHGEIVKLGARA